MKKIVLFIIFVTSIKAAYSQLPQTKILFGTISTIEPGLLEIPSKDKYKKVIDSLDKNLKATPKDTTSLFYRSLLYYTYNQMLAAPYQRTKGTLENLTIAKDMIEKAINNNMKDFRAKILRAQIYSQLCYRFTGDESWMFNNDQIISRRKQFNGFREKANQYYEELAKLDPQNAHEYSKMKLTRNYPIQ